MQNLNGYAYIRCSQLCRTLSTAFTPCCQPVKTVTDPSDQGIITTNYQWSPENYIISRLFPVSFSTTYDDSFLVLGIPSVFRVLKFAFVFLVLWRCWLGGKKGIRPVKTELWGAGMVICLELGADLHMAQLMPLPVTVSCFSKIQIDFTFPVPAHLGSPGKRAIKRLCVIHVQMLIFHCSLAYKFVCFLQ